MVNSIRLTNLKTLEIDVSVDYPEWFTETENWLPCKAIECPNLVEFIYWPFFPSEFADSQIWNVPSLKKLKVCCSQKFMKSLKNLEVLLIAYFERKDEDLLGELPKLKLLDVHEVDAGVFGRVEQKYGRRMRINYRGMPAQFAKNRIRIPDPDGLTRLGEEWTFVEKDLQIYSGQFEQANDQIHFFRFFIIFDSFKHIESSFFRKFVDVGNLFVPKNNTLSQDEILRILSGFRKIRSIGFAKRNFEPDFYEKSLLIACPHLISYWTDRKTFRVDLVDPGTNKKNIFLNWKK